MLMVCTSKFGKHSTIQYILIDLQMYKSEAEAFFENAPPAEESSSQAAMHGGECME